MMSTQCKKMVKAGTTLALTSLLWSVGALAQENKAVTDMARPADDAASCKAMVWHKDFVGTYPTAAEACRAVVLVNGEKWARFEGKFLRSNQDGSFDTEFVGRSDRGLGTVTLMPAAGQRVHIDGKEVRFSDLKRNQVLSFYVPEGATGFTLETKPDSQIVKVINTTEDPTYVKDEAPVLLAQADTRTNENASSLPNTAGPLPLFALGGLMSLLGGLGLTIRRKTLKHTS